MANCKQMYVNCFDMSDNYPIIRILANLTDRVSQVIMENIKNVPVYMFVLHCKEKPHTETENRAKEAI